MATASRDNFSIDEPSSSSSNSDQEQFLSAAEGSENSGSIAGEAVNLDREIELVHVNEIADEALEGPNNGIEGENGIAEADEAILLNVANEGSISSADSDNEDGDDEDEEIMDEEAEEALENGNHFGLGSQLGEKITPGPGCSHYRRGCGLIAPCCDKRYPCRHCHNEAESHEINRFAISEVVCLKCDKRQPISDHCIECNYVFGEYVCLKCRVWDMDFKGQWHCDGCGICRLGGKDHFFHCDRCGYCLSIALRGDHRCIERATRTGCAICLSDLHDTRTPLVVPACGHPV